MKTIVEINNNNYGSTGNIMTNIANSARNSGYKVHTCCKNSKESKKHIHKDEILIGNWLDRVISEKLCYITGLKDHFNVINTKLFINKLNNINPDLIHLHNFHDSYLNMKLFFDYINSNNIPVIWTLHDCWPFTGQCTYFDLVNCDRWQHQCDNCPQINKYPDSKCDKTNCLYNLKKEIFNSVNNLTIVTPSKWLAELVNKSFLSNKNIEVINNGINLDIFKPRQSKIKNKYNIDSKYIVLGVAAGWSERKGLNTFIELSRRLNDDYKIVLVGTNDEIDKELPSNIVSIYKTYNQDELAEIYSEADVFVNPTLEENFPTVNIESIACGTPVITYDTGGAKEMLNNNCGSVIEKGNIDKLEKEIIEVCENSKYKQKDCIKQSKQFDMNDKFNDYVQLYNKVLNS